MSDAKVKHAEAGPKLQAKVESRTGAAITVTRIEVPAAIKSAISDRIAAAKSTSGE